MAVDLCMAYMFMLVSMTLTLMQGHSGLAKAKTQRWIISTSKQAIRIKLARTVSHFYVTLTLQMFIWFDQLVISLFLMSAYFIAGELGSEHPFEFWSRRFCWNLLQSRLVLWSRSIHVHILDNMDDIVQASFRLGNIEKVRENRKPFSSH